jgi:hypothetical protein
MAAGFLAVVVHPLVPTQALKRLVAYAASPVSAPPAFAGARHETSSRTIYAEFSHGLGHRRQYRDVHDMSAYASAATVKADFCVFAG